MPLISDPGSGLVAAAAAAGYPVVPIAGPSAFLLALVASGLSSTRFTFVGFLSDKPKHRQQELQNLAGAAFHIFCFNCKKPAKLQRVHFFCLAETSARSTQAAVWCLQIWHTPWCFMSRRMIC